MATRKHRPQSTVIKTNGLHARWETLLGKKFPGFKWDGSDYGTPDRSQGGGSDGLVKYMEPLKGLLAEAPTGFPTYKSLRDALLKFDGVYDKKVEPLVKLITTKPSTEPASSVPMLSTAPAAPAMPAFPDFEDESEEVEILESGCTKHQDTKAGNSDDDDDCEVVHVKCMCPECQAPVPPPGIGGQKRGMVETTTLVQGKCSKPTRRLRKKTSLTAVPCSSQQPGKPKHTPMKQKRPKQVGPNIHFRHRADSDIALPIGVVTRSASDKRPGESYIVQNTRAMSYVVGCTSRGHASCMSIIAKLAEMINSKRIQKHSDAKQFVHQYIKGDLEWVEASV
ncbi:unnamed protein product [Prorocentrum cordatum]|uniref:Uncharacterized protein n=1 Tax=Prorocentrum cordatum TaxID=2364126 RepID=A0ABN9UMM8_9DINO|nr:unnamed protein product [Polarella glacialis]